jgi:acyl-CoA thioesterase-2
MTDAPLPATARLADDMVALMRLEPLGEDRFRGQNLDICTLNVFGGQVLGQSLMAACLTMEPSRPVHSMHAYFLLPGAHAPIDYAVDRVRDGRSFSTRHVWARQNGQTIFEMAASFQTRDPGMEHQAPMPDLPGPERLPSELDRRLDAIAQLHPRLREKATSPRGIEYRTVEQDDLMAPMPRDGSSAIWMRVVAPLPDDPNVHRALLAYASDHGLLRAAAIRHGLSFLAGHVRAASLDHAMWFHRDFRFDDWLLYVIESPSASGARGLCFGRIYTRDGRLVASTAQEGMMRLTERAPAAARASVV